MSDPITTSALGAQPDRPAIVLPPLWPVPKPEDTRPVDLWAKFDPPPLPPDCLPSVLGDYVFPVAEQMGADPAGLLMAALAVSAAAIPDDVRLQVKAHDPRWLERARLWVAMVGVPSTKKSPMLDSAVRPLVRRDQQLAATWQAQYAAWEALPNDERKTTPEPSRERVRLGDTTVEAAQEAFRRTSRGLLVVGDELSGWFGSLDKYGGSKNASADRAFWLQAYNGGPYPVDRIGRGSFVLPNLSASIVGGIQPSAIRKIACDSVDDGLLQRFCPVVLRNGDVGLDAPIPIQASMYECAVTALFTVKAAGTLRFDPRAQEIFREVQLRHYRMTSVERVNGKLASHIGKLDGVFGRLCIVWHALKHPFCNTLDHLVTAETAQHVAEFMRAFLLPQAFSFYAGVLGLSDEQDALEAVAGYILAHRLKEVTNRTIQRGDRACRRLDYFSIRPLFETLAAMNWLFPVDDPKKRNGEPVWTVNPYVHVLFAERAEREEARRLQARATILEICGQGN